LTTPDPKSNERDHLFPEFLPGGRTVVFTILPTGPIESAQIAALDVQSGARRILVNGGANPRYARSGHLVYAVAETLRAVAFDLERLEVTSDPFPVVDRVVTKGSGAADFAIASDGTLVYVTGSSQGSLERKLVWVDRKGAAQELSVPPRAYVYPMISPDGTQVALDIRDQDMDIWTWNFARQTLTRLTSDPAPDRSPIWSPDGRRVFFGSDRNGASNVFSQAADGTGAAERVVESSTPLFPESFSRDGTQLVLREEDTKTGVDIQLLTLQANRRVEGLLESPFSDQNPDLSPDGRWMAYESNESGQMEIYVRPFPDVNAGRWQVSTGGGTRPAWSRDGRELFYLTGPPGNALKRMMRVPVRPGATFEMGNPQLLFEGPYYTGFVGRTYDVSPDGQRFLMIKDAAATAQAGSPPPQIIVTLNWFDELKRRVPVD
jgi:serine/threonine-protein kinase